MWTKKPVKDMTNDEVDEEIKRLAQHYNIAVDKDGGATATMSAPEAAPEAKANETLKKQEATKSSKSVPAVKTTVRPKKKKTAPKSQPTPPTLKPKEDTKPPKTPEPEKPKTDDTPIPKRTSLAIQAAIDDDLKHVENKDLKERVRKQRTADAEDTERERQKRIKRLLSGREKTLTIDNHITSR